MAQLFSLSGQTLVDGNGAPYTGAKASFFETGPPPPKTHTATRGFPLPMPTLSWLIRMSVSATSTSSLVAIR